MSVDLSQYTTFLGAELNVPGDVSLPDASSTDLVLALRNAFWNARLDGFLVGFTENTDGLTPGIVTPVPPATVDMTRDQVQLVIFFAAKTAIIAQLRTLKTQFRATAGPVSYETQQSAIVLQAVLKDIIARADRLYKVLSQQGLIPISYTDGLSMRDFSLAWGDVYWAR